MFSRGHMKQFIECFPICIVIFEWGFDEINLYKSDNLIILKQLEALEIYGRRYITNSEAIHLQLLRKIYYD